MALIEQVEKLRGYAKISYEEANELLDSVNGDILEAVVKLEREGRLEPPQYSEKEKKHSNEDGTGCKHCGEHEKTRSAGAAFGECVMRFLKWLGRVVHKGNINSLQVSKNDNIIIAMPVTVLVILLIFCFWLVVPLIIISLFFGFRYRFKGPDLGREQVNKVMDKASDSVDDMKKEIKSGFYDYNKNGDK